MNQSHFNPIFQSFGLNLWLAIDFFLKSSIFSSFMICTAKLSEVVVVVILVLFCVMTWSIAHIFRSLHLNIRRLAATSSVDCAELVEYLEKWRYHHSLACRLVNEVKSFFGLILVFAFAHSFVSLITDSFEIAMSLVTARWGVMRVFVCRFGINMTRFSVICYACSLMESEVCLIGFANKYSSRLRLFCVTLFRHRQ